MENITNRIIEILSTTDTSSWKCNDLKTTWLSRARVNGIEGCSKHLKDAFCNSKNNNSFSVNFNFPNGDSFEINRFTDIKEAISLFDKTTSNDCNNADFNNEDVEVELKKYDKEGNIIEIELNELPETHKQYEGWMTK